MKRRERIANAQADLADLNEQRPIADIRRGDEIRRALSYRDKETGIAAFDLLAEREGHGWMLDGRLSDLQRQAASLLLSNRRLP